MTQYAIWFLGCGMCFINVRNYFPHYIYNPKCHIQNQISLQICRRLHGKQKYFLVKIVGSALSCNLFIGHIVTVTDHTFSIIKFTIMGWFKAIFKNKYEEKYHFYVVFAISAWTSGLSSGSDIDSMYQRNITGDYICVNCGYTNKYKQNMQKHVETHIDVPRAICKFCYRTFKTTNSLQSHISTKHREKTTLSMSLS